jgi:hypothetical protein
MMGALEMLLAFIRRQIGLRTDAASATGSLHAKVKNLAEKIGDSADVRTDNTLFGWASSPIKSIQRGVTSVNQNPTNVTISSVGVSKAFVIANGRMTNNQFSGGGITARLTSATNLELKSGFYNTDQQSYGGAEVSWEIIEFY